MIVDAQVDNASDELPCLHPCTRARDVDRSRLLAAAVAAGRLRRFAVHATLSGALTDAAA